MYTSVNKSLSEIKFDYVKPRSKKYKQWASKIVNTEMSFDTETSNGFYRHGKVIPFDKTKPPKFWENYEKVGIMYLWQFAIKDNVFYGRTIEDFIEFMDDLQHIEPLPKIIYVHNLGFDFNACIREYFAIESLFARKERHPLTFRLKDYNCEFRCSYQLTNLSLDNCCKEYNLKTKKLVGNVDYLKIYTPNSKLSQNHLEYGFNDVLIINEIIEQYKQEYGAIYSIPLTQTGEIRRDIQQLASHDYKWLKRCKALNDFNYGQYLDLLATMTGGATHGNRLYINRTIKENITCYDFASSYPWVMLSRKYPLSKFIEVPYNEKYENVDKYSYIIKVKFSQLKSAKYNPYLSEHKALSKKGVTSDNGKVESAEQATYILTNIDMAIVRQAYTWEEMEILYFAYAVNEYLPLWFRNYILDLYKDKTTLKGITDMIALYLKKKQKINACYGMLLTKIFNEIVSYSDDKDEWKTRKFDKEVFDELKEKQDKKSLYSHFLPFQCGLFVTAYARENLFKIIYSNDDLIHYYDTDSVYFSDNEVLKDIEKYNDEVIKRIKEIAVDMGRNESDFSPLDKNGNRQTIGIMTLDGEYTEAKYLGAKRYVLRDKKSGKLKQTVAGVRKDGVYILEDNIDNFNSETVWDYDGTLKNIMTYNECQTKNIVWNKGCYDEYVSTNEFSNNLMPTQFSFTNAINDYIELIKELIKEKK